MFAIYAVNRTALVLFIVFGVIAIIALAFLLNYFVISRSRIKKQMENLQKKFSYLDSLLIGQDSQYISRLELISRTNLLYLDKYDFFSRRFKEVYESDDKYAESMLKQLKALIDNKNLLKNIWRFFKKQKYTKVGYFLNIKMIIMTVLLYAIKMEKRRKSIT